MENTKRVIVTGATGLIGNRLCSELERRAYAVVVFSRDPEIARRKVLGALAYIAWQPQESGSWSEQLDGAYSVVNLAGGSIYSC